MNPSIVPPIGILGLALLLAPPTPLAAQTAQTSEPAPAALSGDLQSGFLNPPESAKPRTWWHWVSGNISKEGITADLEAMKSIGLAGAQIFTVDQSDVKGPVVFMSPEWRQLIHHAISEGDRLGLELSIENCEGWSESGGPWVTPAQSMQKVVWAEAEVQGGQKVSLSVPQPLTLRGYYEDIALFAFPTIPGDAPSAPIRVTTPEGPAGAVISLPQPSPDRPQWVQLEYAKPMAFGTLRIGTTQQLRDIPGAIQWELQVSDDGQTFRKVCTVPPRGTTAFSQVVGRFYRLWLPVMPPRSTELAFTEVALFGVRLDKADAQTGIAADRTVNQFSAAAFPAANIIPANAVVDLTGRSDWDAPPGDWTVVRIGHTSTGIMNHPASPATIGLECDKLSAAAVTAHFEQGMLGTVISDNGPLVGRSLRYVLCDSWEAGCENWTPLLRDEFKRRRGYDLQPWLLTLTGRVVDSQETTQRFLWDFRRTLADLVAENHYGVLQRLAHENHMGLYAEAVGINMPTVADQLQCKGYTDVPMGEFWVGETWPGLTPIDDTKEAASAAHIYGQNIAAAESYTARAEFGDWAQDPYSLKALGDLELCLGINRFVFHRYAHQPWLDRKPGMSMGPWGTNFERTNTWWEPAAAWMSYLSRCQYLLQQGAFAADVCYYYGEGAPVDVKPDLLTPKLPSGFDYDVCNTEILFRMSVANGRIVLPSGMNYRVLVLPDSDRMTVPVLEKIRDLVKAGATVVGPRPSRSPSLTGYPASDDRLRSIAADVWGDSDGQSVTEHNYGQGRVFWGRPLSEVLGIAADFSSTDENLHFIHRHAGDAEIYFISNQAAREVVDDCAFRVSGKIPELWHPDTGRLEQAAFFADKDGVTTLPLHLDPVGSVFVIFRKGADAMDPIVSASMAGDIFPSSGSDAATPLADSPVYSDGRVVFTEWSPATYSFVTASGRTLVAPPADVPPPVRLSGPWTIVFPPNLEAPAQVTIDHLISWTDSMDPGVKFFSGTATYVKDFELSEASFSPGSRQFLDLGAVKNLARVELNGQDLGVLWKEPFRVEITGCAKVGANHLRIKITNLWPNRMIGDLSVPAPLRVTWSSIAPYTATSPILPSGLLGPVVVRTARDVEAR
jgi:hypothetical protein